MLAVACGGSDGDVSPEAASEPEAVATDDDVDFDDLGPVSVRFVVTIENVSEPEAPVELGPGFWIRHRGPDPLFAEGLPDRGEGLQSLAEQRSLDRIASSNERVIRLGTAGLFEAVDIGGPAGPGQSMTFEVEAFPGESVTFVLPFADGEDALVGPGGIGLALFDATRTPITGDVTAVARVWDLGTSSDVEDAQRGVVTPDVDVDVSTLVSVTVEAL